MPEPLLVDCDEPIRTYPELERRYFPGRVAQRETPVDVGRCIAREALNVTPAEHVTPAEIIEQRERGWPDFHPEDYCHRCGRRNIKAWNSPEWVELTGSNAGILCPVCFADHDPDAIWVVTRWHPPDEDQVGLLTPLLRAVTNLGDDAERVARCIIDAGWARHG